MAQIRDPKIKFLKIKSDKADRKAHNTAVAVVANALSRSKIDINYDHIDTTILKDRDIPLFALSKNKTSRADIAFWLQNDILVHVHIDAFRRGRFISDMDIENA